MNIIIKCHSCVQHNRSQLGTQGFVWATTIFNFSDAHHHMVSYPDHCMDVVVIESEIEEQNL